MMDQYAVNVKRLAAADPKHLDKVDQSTFINIVDHLINEARWLDHQKKAMFAGREMPTRPHVLGDSLRNPGPLHWDVVPHDALHGGIGAASESGEVLELYRDALVTGKPVDRDALVKEMGDRLYYTVLEMLGWGITIEEVMKTNIDKLQARWPHKELVTL